MAVLLPLVIALCDVVGYQPGSKGRTGLVLAVPVGTYIVPITFLPANLPNIVLAGSLESLHDVTLTFGPYMLLHFPVIGLVKGVALVLILVHLFQQDPTPQAAQQENVAKPLSGAGPAADCDHGRDTSSLEPRFPAWRFARVDRFGRGLCCA